MNEIRRTWTIQPAARMAAVNVDFIRNLDQRFARDPERYPGFADLANNTDAKWRRLDLAQISKIALLGRLSIAGVSLPLAGRLVSPADQSVLFWAKSGAQRSKIEPPDHEPENGSWSTKVRFMAVPLPVEAEEPFVPANHRFFTNSGVLQAFSGLGQG